VDTENGAQCGPCPAGFVGDGQRCRPDNACKSNPCYAGLNSIQNIFVTVIFIKNFKNRFIVNLKNEIKQKV
jgi:hypothetical protein